MATADGMPLVWGARLLGVNLAGRVTGADMVPALAERANQKGYTLYLLGAAPGVAARAAEVLQARCPNLQIVGVASPPYGSILEMDPAIAEGVRAAHPDILLVAFGNPKQEKWISMNSRSLPVPVMIGVGGTLDLIAGVTRRAPAWMQHGGLEWLYRLVQEPKRLWRRYVVDLVSFGLFFLRQWWVMRKGSPSTLLPTAGSVLVDGTAILTVQGRLDRGNQAGFVRQAEEALAATSYVIVDLGRAEFLDSSAIGTLVGLTKRVREAGGELWLAAVPAPIGRVLALLRLDRFFEVRPDVATALAERRGQVFRVPPQPGGDDSVATEIGRHSEAAVNVIAMPRRLDAITTPAVLEQCIAAVARNPRLILDFSLTTFLASAGMAAMIKLNRQAREAGGELRVAGCVGDVLRTLKLTRLDTVIPLYPDIAAAMK